MITKKQGLHLFIFTAFVLSIPLIAMQFSTEVNWGAMDFVLAAVLLLCAGLIITVVMNKNFFRKYRWLTVAAIVLFFLLLWMEMAVGLFGSPLAGS